MVLNEMTSNLLCEEIILPSSAQLLLKFDKYSEICYRKMPKKKGKKNVPKIFLYLNMI